MRMRTRKTLQKVFALIFVILALAVIYFPIAVMIMFSFTNTAGAVIGRWSGFSLSSFAAAFNDEELMRALGNTLLIAFTSSVLAVIIGTMSAVGIFYHMIFRKVEQEKFCALILILGVA